MALAFLLGAAGCGAPFLGSRTQPEGIAPGHPRSTKGKKTGKTDELSVARLEAQRNPIEPYWPHRIAELCYYADSLPQAEAALREAIRRDSSYAPSLALMSQICFQAGRHAEAVRLLEAARARPGAFPEGVPATLLAGLALHYDALDRFDWANAVMREAARRDPQETRSALVYLTLRGDHPDSATALAAAAANDEPRSAANQNNYGITRLRAGDVDGAKRSFQKAIDLDPALAGPYYNLAILEHFYTFDEEAAARWFAKYRERSSADPDSLFGVFAKQAEKTANAGDDR